MKFLLLLSLLPSIIYSQTADISDIKYTNSDPKSEYRFPKIHLLNNPKISEKINDSLRSQFLYVKPGCPENFIFEEVRTTPEHIAILYDINYKIIYDKKNILSLSLEAQGCGAYCEDFTEHYNFNLKTGNRIYLDSVFTPKGIIVFVEYLNSNKEKQIQKTINNIRDSLKSKTAIIDSISKSDYQERLQLYTECLQQKETKEDVPNLDFDLKDTSISVYIHRCSAHYNMTLDDLGDFKIMTDLKFWKNYLTPYGIEIIKNE
jgi:hypothetical protein